MRLTESIQLNYRRIELKYIDYYVKVQLDYMISILYFFRDLNTLDLNIRTIIKINYKREIEANKRTYSILLGFLMLTYFT